MMIIIILILLFDLILIFTLILIFMIIVIIIILILILFFVLCPSLLILTLYPYPHPSSFIQDQSHARLRWYRLFLVKRVKLPGVLPAPGHDITERNRQRLRAVQASPRDGASQPHQGNTEQRRPRCALPPRNGAFSARVSVRASVASAVPRMERTSWSVSGSVAMKKCGHPTPFEE